MKIHNFFNPNLLCKVSINSLTNQVNKLLLSVIINNKEEWEIEDIFYARTH